MVLSDTQIEPTESSHLRFPTSKEAPAMKPGLESSHRSHDRVFQLRLGQPMSAVSGMCIKCFAVSWLRDTLLGHVSLLHVPLACATL